jgi:hypothetical protein
MADKATLSATPRSAAPSRASCRSCGSSRRLPEGCYRKRRGKIAFEMPIRIMRRVFSVWPTHPPERRHRCVLPVVPLPVCCSGCTPAHWERISTPVLNSGGLRALRAGRRSIPGAGAPPSAEGSSDSCWS